MQIAENAAHGSTAPPASPMNRRPPNPTAARPPGVVRIIGGQWRGTRLAVPERAGLRPTADRVRETLFNWLMPKLPGARVLDVFAGTGALGLEAVSRGAASAVLVERDPGLAEAIRAVAARLPGGDRVEVANADALAWLRAAAPSPAPFDLVFLDPPFDAGVWTQALDALRPWLAPEAWLYLESPRDAAAVPDAGEWVEHRSGETRDVRYSLYRRRAA